MAKSAKKKTTARRPKTSVKATGTKSKKSRVAMAAAPEVTTDAVVLDRLFAVIESRRDADPNVSHSARLLSRGPAKVAQKFGEEAVECLIEAVTGNRDALIAESADVLYHLLVLWASSGVIPAEVWAELIRREGVSGIAEKAARAKPVVARRKLGTSKIP
jgi:phosphoribosyl-ATP pyrophosphohydrolase